MLKTLVSNGHGRLADGNNLFTLMRIGLALIVLAGHSVQISRGLEFAPGWPQSLDYVVHRCLDGFFILSGYMITVSVLNNGDIKRYTLSRLFRIMPGLIVATLILWLIVGPIFTALTPAAYWSDPQTLSFPLLILSQAEPLAGLPGVFDASPAGGYANGPLWTIRYEILAYIGVGLLLVLGLYQKRSQIVFWSVAAIAGALVYQSVGYVGPGDDTIGSMARFAPAFMIGAGFFALRDKLHLSPATLALYTLAALLGADTIAGPVLEQIATAAIILWLGYRVPSGKIGTRLTRIEDISYGIYILHWPIGMMVFSLAPGMNTLTVFALMLPLSLVAGWLMRVGIEKPAMRMKDALSKPRSAQPVFSA